MSRTSIKHFKRRQQTFDGMYRGVVEDNLDPDELGRCRIRVWGIHSADKSPNSGIPTDQLPWAQPALGLLEGSQSGVGAFAVPQKGAHVFLFFEGSNWASPVYFATVPGKSEVASDPNVGFNDPDGVYPVTEYVGESDFPKISRGVKADTIHATRDAGLLPQEPANPYGAVYPDNIVIATNANHTIELDNTQGAERVHIYHGANTYLDMIPNGGLISHCSAAHYIGVATTYTVNIGGAENTTVGGSSTWDITGSHTVTSADLTYSAGSTINMSAGGDITINASGTLTLIGANVVVSGATIALN